eukprot:TRINITY_DN2265_c0_g1_i1.p1 TRINITY_DN2265_c0_g1~~TRINITY_DN2265_c0_g1_i1.p1  ORF type:complete len:335 (-),score=52.89 TRINITY_DN2265_c0_g1_i1:166-1170(-)
MWLLGIEVNLIWGMLWFYSLWMIGFGVFVLYFESRLPRMFRDAFKYGKTLGKGESHSIVKWIQVPKAYFGHFYIFASLYILSIIGICLNIYLKPLSSRRGVEGSPEWVKEALDFIGGSGRRMSSDVESVLLVLLLFGLQSLRRLYECFFINVDTGSRMNILHYIVGITHYFCAFTGVLLEAPGFTSREDLIHYKDSEDSPSRVKWIHIHLNIYNYSLRHLLWTLVFLWAWKLQFDSHKAFASLKRRQLRASGESVFAVPMGGGFTLVSCPHYLAEILMYGSIAGILGFRQSTMNVVALWVIINQVISGLMSHQWYLKSFPNYPSSRKAVIPFLL